MTLNCFDVFYRSVSYKKMLKFLPPQWNNFLWVVEITSYQYSIPACCIRLLQFCGAVLSIDVFPPFSYCTRLHLIGIKMYFFHGNHMYRLILFNCKNADRILAPKNIGGTNPFTANFPSIIWRISHSDLQSVSAVQQRSSIFGSNLYA